MLPRIWERFLNSVPIFLLATLIEWSLAFPVGIRAAVRRGSVFDRSTTFVVLRADLVPELLPGLRRDPLGGERRSTSR